jgi:hypothetical protein
MGPGGSPRRSSASWHANPDRSLNSPRSGGRSSPRPTRPLLFRRPFVHPQPSLGHAFHPGVDLDIRAGSRPTDGPDRRAGGSPDRVARVVTISESVREKSRKRPLNLNKELRRADHSGDKIVGSGGIVLTGRVPGGTQHPHLLPVLGRSPGWHILKRPGHSGKREEPPFRGGGMVRATEWAIGLPLVRTEVSPSPGTSAVVLAGGERRSRWEG